MKNLTFLIKICLIGIILSVRFQIQAQTAREYYNAFRNRARQDYDDFRLKANLDYIEYLRRTWDEFQKMPALPVPTFEPPIPPIVIQDEALNKPIHNEQIPIDGTVFLDSDSSIRPSPISPIPNVPYIQEIRFEFVFMGTKEIVRIGDVHRIHLTKCDENSVANAWASMCHERFNNVIFDCLMIKQKRNLCDWAYYIMLSCLGDSFYGKNTNESVLLTAFIYSQSGYSMRLANTRGRLEMLFASKHKIYSLPFFEIDTVRYYSTNTNDMESYIMPFGFPGEQPMSLIIEQAPQLTELETPQRCLQSMNYSNIRVNITTNINLIDFYSTYPTSQVDENFMTRWAIYAETPLSSGTQEKLYPTLKRMTQDYSQVEAANRLLNWVQTAFTYDYDDKVWGEDRVFFAEETLFYPYCDCEDRSILFSRLVRDILGLKVVLVYYPGHLATAVAFSEPVQGDFLMLDNVKYTLADPTYINAPVGLTMPDLVNKPAIAILLK